MKSLLLFLIPLALLASLQAPSNLPKYKVLKTESGDAYLTSLNQFADQGYRVLAASKYSVLRLEATPPDTYRYALFEVQGGPVQFTNWLNQQGARGYRWVPNVELLEKSPHPKNYEYRNSPHGHLVPSKERELSSVINGGYHPVGRVVFHHELGSPTVEMYFEREVTHTAFAGPQSATVAIKVAEGMRVGKVMRSVDELSKQGYRFLSLHETHDGMAVIMEKCPQNCAGRYEYRYFDAKNASQIERELNALGKDGFRVVPTALVRRPHLLERDAQNKRTFFYHALSPSDAGSLQNSLNSLDQEGYEPIDFVRDGGFWTSQGILVLAKETTVSSAP